MTPPLYSVVMVLTGEGTQWLAREFVDTYEFRIVVTPHITRAARFKDAVSIENAQAEFNEMQRAHGRPVGAFVVQDDPFHPGAELALSGPANEERMESSEIKFTVEWPSTPGWNILHLRVPLHGDGVTNLVFAMPAEQSRLTMIAASSDPNGIDVLDLKVGQYSQFVVAPSPMTLVQLMTAFAEGIPKLDVIRPNQAVQLSLRSSRPFCVLHLLVAFEPVVES